MLQHDLNKISEWCMVNGMSLNVKKCVVMSLTHSPNKRTFDYVLNDVILERVAFMKDLGVIIDEKLSFKEHINMITRKSYQMLGFIFRCGKYFSHQSSLLILYNALVRNRLEYCSTVWNPIYDNSINQIERVQKKFTRMFYFKFNLEQPRPSYDIRLKRLKLHSLESRRLENDEIILFKIMHRFIDSTSLHQRLNFYQPTRPTRWNKDQVFYMPKMSTNYEANAPINRIQSNHDEYFSAIDIFCDKLNKFKKDVRQFLNF